MDLKDSQTLNNLKDAFAGESQANRRYLYFAANEDLERSNEEKTSAVYFLRFELGSENSSSFDAGAKLCMGIDTKELPYNISVVGESRASLKADLE